MYALFKTTHDRIYVIGNKYQNEWTTNVNNINNPNKIIWKNKKT